MSTTAARHLRLAPIPPGQSGTSAATRLRNFRAECPAEAARAEKRDCPFCPARAGDLCRTARGELQMYHYARLREG